MIGKTSSVMASPVMFFLIYSSQDTFIGAFSLQVFLIGGYPVFWTTSYPTLMIRKSYETLLPCSIGVKMSTGSYVFCNRRSQQRLGFGILKLTHLEGKRQSKIDPPDRDLW